MENECNKGNCEACGLDILGDFFARCVKCDINYHIQCGDPVSLPPTVVYEHHEHPLVLTETLAEDDSTLFYCYACVKERNPKHSFYFCAKCEYSTHVHCVITKVQLVERKKLKHFSHQHFLILQENGDVCYSACENFIQGASYGCDPCNYYLHQFCAALPKTLLHPYHQHHLPLQKPFVGIYRQCSACHKHGNGYMFSCVNCKFNLDVDCISLQRPSMKIESHEHIVTIFKKLHRSPKCICCNSASSNIIYLCCMRCNYIVHLWCAPLPKIIKHESHHYPLFITDYLFDKAYDEEVCDICEETRDQEECVYYCADCDFVAEFNCVLSKVMACLKGERGPVSLRTIDREITDKVIKKGSSLQDIHERN
ncbi:phorbol-ester/DAG-type domain-containing protein [Citrus sinensis]|uniref:Phorbol-ester/DAG-type domain-containing protein n=1 Tax=Citrus sinensis TaxID=2711 RepID=A0ACB8MUH9_CITSI|nr:phorbol-ester/DAG-type domain-containing protein [Citrus sinensis]KAH9789466.1 phorbol-ester/DAG-type domain-containing protein [Citrus sinensis]